MVNLLFVGRFSYVAFVWAIIGRELLLALLFYADLRHHLGQVAWGRMWVRPLLAGLAMGTTAWAVAAYSFPLALLSCVLVYFLALILLCALTPEEWAILTPLLPSPLRRLISI